MVRKILVISGAVILAGLIIVQFFQPPKNQAPVTDDGIVFQIDIPDYVKKPLVNSCYDCHSNQTRYPWYGRIAPFSWMMNNHIVQGKQELNFSEWGTYSKRKQIGLLDEIVEVIENGSMPLESYLLLHADARLYDHEIEAIRVWSEDAIDQVFDSE
jgi:hypothetical protein